MTPVPAAAERNTNTAAAGISKMGAACAVAGILCLLYYILLRLLAPTGVASVWLWLFLGGFCLISALILRITCRSHSAAGHSVRVITILLVLVMAGALGCGAAAVIHGMRQEAPPDLEYVVVLGAQVRGKTPSRSLSLRLARALEYAQENEHTRLILSGGQGRGEDISEATCMYNYLSTHGISADRLIMEPNSTTTKENLQFSDVLTGCSKCATGILSNDFHIFRALALARAQGYTEPYGIPAPSYSLMQVHFIVREIFALAAEKLAGDI